MKMSNLVKSELCTLYVDSTKNPFHSEPFRSCWFEHLAVSNGVQARHTDFVLHHKQVAKGLITLKELKFFAGTTAWFHDFTEAQVQSFLELQGQLEWDYFYGVWAGSRQSFQAFQTLEDLGYPIVQGFTKPMHMVDLSEGYQAYLVAKSSKHRYQIRQKLQKVKSLYPQLIVYDRTEDIEPFFQQFFRYHIAYWTQKTGTSFCADPQEQAFMMAFYKELHKAGKLLLQALCFNGEPVNLSVSFWEGNTLYWPLMINTGRYLEYMPGLVSLYMRIENAADRGFQFYNMGYGDFVYKVQAETHRIERNVIVIAIPKIIERTAIC
jgi:hypothetical protein